MVKYIYMNIFWRLLGFVLSIIGGFISFAMQFNYAWSGCGATIECAVVPRVAWVLTITSFALFVFIIYCFISSSPKAKLVVSIYIIVAIILVFTGFIFKRGGVGYTALRNTPFECSLFSDYRKDICKSSMAKEKNDVKICDDINNSLWKNDCTGYFAKQSNDSKLCGPEDVSCLLIIAGTTKDQKICEQITNIGARSNCYTLVAEQSGDKSICKKPDNSPSKCNRDSLIYPATKIIINPDNTSLLLAAGTKGKKVAQLNLLTIGGDGALGGLSIIDQSIVKLENVKLSFGSLVISPIRSIKISNQVIPNGTQYDFEFGKEPLMIRENKQTPVIITGDIPSTSTGKTVYIAISGASYPSGLSPQIEGIGTTLVSTLAR